MPNHPRHARWSLLGVLALVGMTCSACSSHAAVGSVVAVVRPSPPAVQVSGEPGYLALGRQVLAAAVQAALGTLTRR